MSRRTVKPYSTRVVLPYDKIMGAAQAGPFFVCLSEGQIEVIRYLLQYARREVNWLVDDTALPSYYGVPNDAEMAQINDMLDDLEGGFLMPQCAENITDELEAITTELALLRACLCTLASVAEQQALLLPDVTGYVDQELVTYDLPGNVLGAPTTPGTDDEKCELAQAIYAYVYQVETETLLPFANSTADTITNTIIGMSAFGAVATWVGVPFAILSIIFATVVAWGVDGSIANFTNWLLGIKDEFVCAVYSELPDYDAAVAAVHALIDAAEEPTFLDKQLLKALCQTWQFTMAADNQQAEGAYDEYIIEGFCDDCLDIPSGCEVCYPCDLGDWVGGSMACVDGFPRIGGASLTTLGCH